MITSTVSQLHWYKIISPNFEKAIEYALSADFSGMEPGKYPIDGDNVFVIVNEFTTKPTSECEPESHQAYADIQMVISGIERYGYAPLLDQTVSTPYVAEKDIAFYSIPDEEMNYLTVSAGQFLIFFPSDIHQPEVFVNQPSLVKKVVIKISL